MPGAPPPATFQAAGSPEELTLILYGCNLRIAESLLSR